MYLFWWDHIFYRTTSLLSPSSLCLLMTRKKNGRKRRLLSEFWLSFHAKDDQRKIAKFDNQLTFEPQKVPETSQQSTINLALCVVSMVWEKEKEKEHFYCFQLQWQVLTCFYHGGFLLIAANCICGIECNDWFLAGTRYCTWYQLYLTGMIWMFSTRYLEQEYHQIGRT